MQQIVNVTIDESGRSRASAKSIGIQYETGVAKFLVTPAPSWVNDDYFYYLIISPPGDSGNEQYAVPLINKGGVFEYQIGSGITWHVGNYKFAFIAMSEQLSSDGRVPTTGIVSISEAWTCNIESGILRLNELDKQPTDPNFTLLYDDLMALSVAVESKGNYAKTQGDYAKNIGDELKVKQEIGAFNGTPGSDGTSAGFGTPSAIVTTLEDNEDATVKVTASGEDTAKVFNFEFGIPKGAKGDKGEPGTDGINGTNGNDGANGKGIASIIRTEGTGEPGTIDTYTITYTDNTTSTYEVYNGKDGINGENGSNGITPHIGENGNWWLGTVDTGVCAQTSVVIDGKMSDTSENTVQNKVIKSYVDIIVQSLKQNVISRNSLNWNEVDPKALGYIANKPFGPVSTFENTTHTFLNNETHTGTFKYDTLNFEISIPNTLIAENAENITAVTLKYNSKNYYLKQTSNLKKTFSETKTYSTVFKCSGKFGDAPIPFEFSLSKNVKTNTGVATLSCTLSCDLQELITAGVIAEIPEDGTLELTFGLTVTTVGTSKKLIEAEYLPIATENNIGAVKPGTGLTIDEQGSINVSVDLAMSDTSENPVQNKVIKQYVDNLVGDIETVLQTINSGSGV